MSFEIDPSDERLHAPIDNPVWRESFWLDAHDATNDISLVIYAHAHPNSSKADLFTVIHGRDFGRIEFDRQGLPYDPRKHEGTAVTIGGFRHSFSQPEKAVTAALALEGAQLDVSFSATGPIYDYDWEKWTNSRHYEQFGTLAGSLVIRDRRYQINALATRDHAWGARGKVTWRRWVWLTVRFAGGKGWGACVVDADQSFLLGYFADSASEEMTHASLKLNGSGQALKDAQIEIKSPSHSTRARVTPYVIMPRSGTDPTKGGTYHYYFVEVEDEHYGKGRGLLNVYSTPGYVPPDAPIVSTSLAQQGL